MKRFLAATLVLTLATSMACAQADNKTNEVVLWGKQTAGSGHAKNAKTDGNTVVLTAPATIISVEGDVEGYCIWSIVTPKNRTASSVLCGGKGRKDIIGKTLGPGSYRLIPGLYGKREARVTIKLKKEIPSSRGLRRKHD